MKPVDYAKNYITIDEGTKDGVQIGMGIIADNGIVGIVKAVSNNYATVTSLLHQKFMCSVKVGKKRELTRLVWKSKSYKTCNLLSLPKHVNISKGDSVFTSGYGGVFPEEILVGIVKSVETKKEKSFHNVEVNLINDFNKLNNAYVVIDRMKEEKETIIETKKENE